MIDSNRQKVTNLRFTSTKTSNSHNNFTRTTSRRRTTAPLLTMSSTKTILLISVTILGFFINDVSTLVSECCIFNSNRIFNIIYLVKCLCLVVWFNKHFQEFTCVCMSVKFCIHVQLTYVVFRRIYAWGDV